MRSTCPTAWLRSRPEDDGVIARYPGGCPQRWTEVDTGEQLVEGGSCRYAVGDHGRLVEKLSPGMCTGWGDLVAAGSRQVTDRTIRRSRGDDAKTGIRAMDIDLTCVYTTAGGSSVKPVPSGRRRGTPPPAHD